MNARRRLLVATWVVLTAASIASLALSEVLGLVPCELCWYQRGLLYPQVVIVGVALVIPLARLALLTIPFSLAGIGVAGYHSWLQLQPNPGDTCSVINPCSEVTLSLGGLSIPNLSFVTFVLVLGLVLLSFRRDLVVGSWSGPWNDRN